MADSISFTFADGKTDSVPCCYIEFAERLLLPQFKDLPDEKVQFLLSIAVFLSQLQIDNGDDPFYLEFLFWVSLTGGGIP